MGLHFILGRRGTGKTCRLYEEIFAKAQAREGPLYLLVPEQSTFIHERAIDDLRQGRSLWDLEVTSFTHLAGRFVKRPALGKLGKKFLVYQVLKENRGELETFGKSALSAGFLDELLSVLAEIDDNLLSPAEMRRIAAALAESRDTVDLPEKLRDLARLREALDGKIGERDLWDQEMLGIFAGEASRHFAGAHFYFDDFYDFTALEYKIIAALRQAGADLTFSLLYDEGGDDGEEPALQKTAAAYRRLRALDKEAAVVSVNRRLEAPEALLYLEKEYGRPEAGAYRGDVAGLRLFWGRDIRGEVEGVAQQIARLFDSGFQPEEIALCLRSASPYDRVIAEVFPAYGIGFDLATPHSLADAPLFAYLRDFLRLFAEAWSFPAVMTLVKNGLFPIAPAEADRFENYCLAHAIKGRRFYQEEDWPYQDEEIGLAEINALRRGIRDFLHPYGRRIKKAVTMGDYALLLWDFLEESGVYDVLRAWAGEEERRGRPLKAKELLESYDAAVEILEQLAAAFPDAAYSRDEVADLLELAFGEAQMRSIPLSARHVEIGILGMSRLGRKRAVFLLGVNEGVFPAPLEKTSLFHMEDREILSRLGDFWPQNRQFFYDQESILIYQALTMAKEALYLSFSLEGAGEETAGPSEIVFRLEQLFPALVREEKTWRPGSGNDGEFLWSPERTLSHLGWALAEGAVHWKPVAAHFQGQPLYRQRVDRILGALDYRNLAKRPGAEQMKRYHPGDLFLNVSAMETYRRCPFSYFAKYGLRLRERRELVFKAPDIGNIFHEALRSLAEEMARRGLDWNTLGMEGPKIIGGITAEIMRKFGEDNLFSPGQAEFVLRRIEENLLLIIEIMAAQTLEGDRFVPIGWEVAFGPNEKIEGQRFRLPLPDREIVLTGQIDRVDKAEEGGGRYFRVIDYKTGDIELKLDDIYHGVKVQLLLYMMMVEKTYREGEEGGEAAGIFYFTARDFFLTENMPVKEGEAKEKLLKKARLKGYMIGGEEVMSLYPAGAKRRLSREEYGRLRRHLGQMIEGIGAEILLGENEITPYYRKGSKSCDYCPYLALCGFDPRLGNRLRFLHAMKDEAVWERIGKEEESDALDGKSKTGD